MSNEYKPVLSITKPAWWNLVARYRWWRLVRAVKAGIHDKVIYYVPGDDNERGN